MNIDVASEFIVFAATLMRIKAKMLLPRKEKNELGEDIDPREELIKKLIEYKRFKDVLDEFRGMEETQSKKQTRGNVSTELQAIAQKALVDVELESVSLYKLMNVFNRLLTKMNEPKGKVVHKIFDYKYTIEDQSDYIRSRITKGRKLNFETLFTNLNNRVHAIVTFLALLEMLSQQQLSITLGEGANNFWIIEKQHDEEE